MSRAKGEISGRLMEPREIKLVGMVESVAREIQGRKCRPPWHIPRSREKKTIAIRGPSKGKSYIENLRNFISIGSDRVINGYRMILCEKNKEKKKEKERDKIKSFEIGKLANFKIGNERTIDKIIQKNCIIDDF